MRHLALICLAISLLPGFPAAARGNPAILDRDAHIAQLIARVKASTMAVGTYKFSEKPPARFLGTGFIIGDGTRVVTNHHVIAPIKEKKRLFYLHIFNTALPKKRLKATLIADDAFHDLAILRIDKKLPALALARPGAVQEGHAVAFTGYPIGFVLGLNPTTHTGIVSAIAPIILPSLHGSMIDGKMLKHLRKPYDILQIDAVAFPGNSGSPVYRIATGEVVGVINKVFIKGKKEHALKDPTGLTYAIPAKYIQDLAVRDLAGQP
ncbi:MAG: trypsin-like peptidase domain-containing protein [Desulfobacter sp.]|nr:MAG: trypsin-like peptidase domain-containing protein [Desulfobacter sp.]